jgi:hypothetical protein
MLSEAAEDRLRSWLGAGTWHTNHNNDMDRWYDFVDQYQRDHGFEIDETALREHIEQAVGESVNEALRNVIRRRISLAYDILDFLKRTGR